MEDVSVIQFASNVILAAMWVMFFDRTLERRFKMWAIAAIFAATTLTWIATIVFFLPYGSALRALIGPVIFLLAAFICYKSRWTRVVFSLGLTQVVMIISEFVIMLLVPSIQALTAETGGMNAVDDLTQLGMFLIYLPINGALLWLASLLFVRYNARLTGRDWIFYALFPVSQMALCISLFLLMAQGISRAAVSWQGAAVLICIAADVGLYFSMRGMEQRAAIAAENAMLERQIVLQRDHRAALQEQYENVRKMRADIDDHLAAIQHMLENGKSSEAASYAAELRPKTAYQSSLGQCENPIADAFLYSRIGELRAQGVDVTAEISIPARLSISSTDLIIAFGNLLDNASEACREIENKRLSVTARIIKGYLAIETENPVPLNSDKNKPRRVQELPRGVGFHILQELADKYDGAFTYHIQNGVFHAQLALKEADV